MAPAPRDKHTALVQRIKSLRAALRITTNPARRQAILDDLNRATFDLTHLLMRRDADRRIEAVRFAPLR